MTEVGTLLALEIRSLCGFNRFLHTKDRKEKNRYRLLTAAWGLLLALIMGYVGALVYGLCSLGLGDIVPAYLVLIASALILVFGLFTAGNRIFGTKGYELLSSMPVKSCSVVISRFLALYGENLAFCLAVMVPGIGVYAACSRPPLSFYPGALLGIVLIPSIPLVICLALGTVIMAISSRMKHKSLVQTLLAVALVVGVVVGSFSMGSTAGSISLQQLSQLAQAVGQLIGRIYPPARWLGDALTTGAPGSLTLFVLVSLGVMAVTVWAVAANFQVIMGRLGSFSASHSYQIGELGSRGVLKALYLREVRRYFSSSIYVTNTIMGPILGSLMALSLCFTGLDTVEKALPFELELSGILPFAVGAVSCMMTTTSVAISMEGKQFWVVKSLPVPTKKLLDSKILLNLSLMLPFYVLSVVAMAVAARPDFPELILLALIPGCLMVFSVVLGVTVNLKFHSFRWEKEEAVVKQSLSAMLGGLAGPLLAVLLAGILLVIPREFAGAAKGLICLALLLTTAVLYRRNNTARLMDL